ncbi:MAG: cupin domain-containing protein [Clostridiales bacterium]|nr:cupin domain-containing protein [Clostridiales bacterium]
MFVKKGKAMKFDLTKGILSSIMGNGGNLMIVENVFVKGAVADMHAHPHEQAGYVVKGKFKFTIGDEVQIIEKGESFYIKPNVIHGCVALEDGIIIDAFSPIREDFVKIAK